MIRGIPYFGEETQQINEQIDRIDFKSARVVDKIALADFVMDNIDKNIIVVIDDNNGRWLTWLNDIQFNYRDRICNLPYFSFELFKIKEGNHRTNNKGHLILKDGSLYIRYKYNYHKMEVWVENCSLNCVDIDTMDSFLLKPDAWSYTKELDLDKLYNLYIESCYYEDDFLITKHYGGYHYIDRSPKEFRNSEKRLREKFGCSTYDLNFKMDKDYRDVRNYKYQEVVSKKGMIDSNNNYHIRRLLFEAYLFGIIRNGLLNNLNFKHGISKISEDIPLLIKEYWLDNKERKIYTWSRY